MSTPSPTERLAAFAAQLALDDVPADLADKIKLHLLDAIGCGLAGAKSDLAQRLLRFTALEHGPGPCAVFGTGMAFGPAAEAFANAAAMNALDHDDGFEVDGKGMGHPGATLVAAALSAIWERPIDGKTFLAALVAAYEINGRVILSMQPSLARFRQVYEVYQHQVIGAAAAYGRLAGLDGRGLHNAFGLAGTLACVPSLRKYNWQARPLVSFKDFNAPAAEAGVRAVQLESCGIVGAHDVLGGEAGLWRMLGSDRFDQSLLSDGLGEIWQARSGSFKPYPACRWMHTALESFETLRNRHGLEPDEIERVTVLTSAGLQRDFMDAAPLGMVDAQFSLPYGLACLALRDPAPRWYEPTALADSRRLALARFVEARIDPEIDAQMSGEARRPAGQVLVKARGKTFEGPRLSFPRGTAERPMSREEIVGKFRINAADSMPPERADALAESLLAIENVADVGRLLGFLVPSSP